MGNQKSQVSYAHLHAYTDQELVDQRRVDVADFVKTHPNLVIYIRDYQFLNEQLHKLYDGVLQEPVPKRLINVVKKHKTKKSNWKNIVMMIWVGMLLGAVIGVLLHHQSHEVALITKAKQVIETIILRFI